MIHIFPIRTMAVQTPLKRLAVVRFDHWELYPSRISAITGAFEAFKRGFDSLEGYIW